MPIELTDEEVVIVQGALYEQLKLLAKHLAMATDPDEKARVKRHLEQANDLFVRIGTDKDSP